MSFIGERLSAVVGNPIIGLRQALRTLLVNIERKQMRRISTIWARVIITTILALETFPVATAAETTAGTWNVPAPWMLYAVPIIVFLCAIIGIAAVRKALPQTWSLADALSEEVAIKPATKTTTSTDAQGNQANVVEHLVDKDGKPILVPEMRASSSRVIALMGMIAIILMYIGFGTFALYSFGVQGKLSDDLNGGVSYLLSGMTLFAPYAVNKFASLFQGLTARVRHFSRAKRINGALVAIKTRSWRAARKLL